MNLDDLDDDPEDPQHTAAERAAAGTRSTWVSVGVNVCLTVTQVSVGVLAKSQGLVADGIHSLSDLVADFVRFAKWNQQRGTSRLIQSGQSLPMMNRLIWVVGAVAIVLSSISHFGLR